MDSILIKDVSLIKFSKEYNVENIFFRFLYQLNERDPFELHENLFILNFLLNLTTHGEFYKRVENKLFCNNVEKPEKEAISQTNLKFSFHSIQTPKNKSQIELEEHYLLNRIDHYDRNKTIQIIYEQYLVKYSGKIKKFKIQSIWFLDVLVRMLFEIIDEETVLKLFLHIFHDFIKHSQYNLAFVANNNISLKLLLYFRFEENPTILNQLNLIIADILRNNTKVSHIRVLTNILKYPFDFKETLLAANNLCIFENHEFFKKKAHNPSILKSSLREMSLMIESIVEDHKKFTKEKETLYFSGNSSGIILKNFNSFPVVNFSMIFQIKFEDLTPFQKTFIGDNKKTVSSNESISGGFSIKRSFNLMKNQRTGPRLSDFSKTYSREFNNLTGDHIMEVEIHKILTEEEYPKEIQKISYLWKDTTKKNTPTIFSLYSSENCSLRIFLEDEKSVSEHNQHQKNKKSSKKNLKIVCYKKEKFFEQIFPVYLQEDLWYDFVICSKEVAKKRVLFELFVNGDEIKPYAIQTELFPKEDFEFLKSLNLFTIGCNPPEFLKQNNREMFEDKIELSDCFAGEIRNLLLLDIALNDEENKKALEQIKNVTNFISEKSNNVYKSKNIVLSLDDFSILADIKMGFDFIWFEILNKNEIKYLEIEKIFTMKETPLQSPDIKKNFVNKLLDLFGAKRSQNRKSKIYNDFKIYAKEVTLIENASFFETIFTLGNVEIIFYFFEILSINHNNFPSETK